MEALESRIDDTLKRECETVGKYEIAAQLFDQLRNTVSNHRKELQSRLSTSNHGASLASKNSYDRVPISEPFDLLEPEKKNKSQVSNALDEIYMLLSHALFRYIILHAMSHRFFQSTGDNNTADLAEKHLRDYAIGMQQINQLISDITVLELGDFGFDCQCQCPSCGLGLCLCAPHGITTINKIFREVVPLDPLGGILVRPPKANGAAIRAGLKAGDIILEADGVKINGWMDIQVAIGKHQSGGKMKFKVKHGEDIREILVKIP